MPKKITLGPSPEKNSKVVKSIQQYNLTYSGRVPIKHIHPLWTSRLIFFNYESQLVDATWSKERLSC